MFRNTLAGRMMTAAALAAIPLAFPATGLAAQDLPDVQKKVSVHTLDNGWTFIIYERHTAPVFSFSTYVDVGAAQEVPGITGLAHMFEHMAFKGTRNIGTTNHKAEQEALDRVDEAYHAYDAARRKPGADPAQVEALEKAWKQAQEDADKYVLTEFDELVERHGGVGLNAGTSADHTVYFYSLPSNKTELWAFLESERFSEPVFREFYKERDVVKEERRMRTESQPIGRLIEQFQAAAYIAHPYGQPTVGHMSDLQSFTREDAVEFYRAHYPPSNIVICLAGDVYPDEVRKLADKYFADWRSDVPKPEPVRTIEPKQLGERRVVIEDPGQPFYVLGFHKPAATHPDARAYDVLTSLLANGRSSRLHERLVKEEKKAIAVGAITQLPGELYPGLFLVFVVPAKDVTALDCEASVFDELGQMKQHLVAAEELDGVKTRMRADWVRSMTSNNGMAGTLLQGELILGSWQRALNYGDELDAVTAEDLMRISQEMFIPSNRTVGYIVTEQEGEQNAR